MGLKVGDWVELQDGRTGAVVTWNTESGEAVAETVAGDSVERPINFAQLRWRVIPEDGLRVQTALDPELVATKAKKTPADLVVMALKDLGGAAETAQLKQALSPGSIPQDEFERWWKRVQVRLDTDDRLDTSKAREKRYRLRREGESRTARDLRPAKQTEQRHGRFLADAPQLKAARERAAKPGPYSDVDDSLFRLEYALTADGTVDPTDRFMASELLLWLERGSEEDVSELLEQDILSVDLLRVPQHRSRTQAIQWGFRLLDSTEDKQTAGGMPLYRSALAVGPPWSDQVIEGLGSRGLGIRMASEGILGWAVPGSEDAGPLKLPDDAKTFDKRVERAERMLGALDQDGLIGLWAGAVQALDALPPTGTHAPMLARLGDRLARLSWATWARIDSSYQPNPDELAPLKPDTLFALIRNGSRSDVETLRGPVTNWYSADPHAYSASLERVAEKLDVDVLSLGLDAARQQLARTTLPRIAANLLSVASKSSRTSPNTAEIVNLAVTTNPNDPFVSRELDRIAATAARAFIDGTDVGLGPVTFSRTGWPEFGRQISLRIEDADAREAKALKEAAESSEEAAQLRRVAETRTAALAEARSDAGSNARQDSGRLAVNLLKPVAQAVGDSFEGSSFEALRDRLLGVLQRARIRPILEVGEEGDFDPVRHQWVGEGYPVDRIRALSPGFFVSGEGEENVVLVPARVVAAAK